MDYVWSLKPSWDGRKAEKAQESISYLWGQDISKSVQNGTRSNPELLNMYIYIDVYVYTYIHRYTCIIPTRSHSCTQQAPIEALAHMSLKIRLPQAPSLLGAASLVEATDLRALPACHFWGASVLCRSCARANGRQPTDFLGLSRLGEACMHIYIYTSHTCKYVCIYTYCHTIHTLVSHTQSTRFMDFHTPDKGPYFEPHLNKDNTASAQIRGPCFKHRTSSCCLQTHSYCALDGGSHQIPTGLGRCYVHGA